MPANICAPLPSEDIVQALYNWIDQIPFSRPKRNISRDFADGVLVAELIHHFAPSMVEMHNYSPGNSFAHKMYNWETLNTKALRKLGFKLHIRDIEDCANVCKVVA